MIPAYATPPPQQSCEVAVQQTESYAQSFVEGTLTDTRNLRDILGEDTLRSCFEPILETLRPMAEDSMSGRLIDAALEGNKSQTQRSMELGEALFDLVIEYGAGDQEAKQGMVDEVANGYFGALCERVKRELKAGNEEIARGVLELFKATEDTPMVWYTREGNEYVIVPTRCVIGSE